MSFEAEWLARKMEDPSWWFGDEEEDESEVESGVLYYDEDFMLM